MSQDFQALLLSYGYVGACVLVGEVAARRGASREFARKFIHVGVGLWIFGVLGLFEHRTLAVVPSLTAAVANWIIHRKRLLRAVETTPDNLGTVWFALSFSALVWLAWDRPAVAAGGVLAMAVGDALASLVGRRFGRHRYATLGGEFKSLEGSMALLAGTFLSLLAAITWMPGLAPEIPRVPLALLCAVVATCAEALGTRGRDNLWVPLAAGAVLAWTPAAHVTVLGLGAAGALLIGVAAWSRGSLSASGVPRPQGRRGGGVRQDGDTGHGAGPGQWRSRRAGRRAPGHHRRRALPPGDVGRLRRRQRGHVGHRVGGALALVAAPDHHPATRGSWDLGRRVGPGPPGLHRRRGLRGTARPARGPVVGGAALDHHGGRPPRPSPPHPPPPPPP